MKEKEDKLINLHSSARYNLTDKAKKERMQRFSSSAILEEVMEAIFPSSIYCISCGSITDGSRYCSICDSCIEKFLWVQEETCDICGRVLSRDGIYDTVFVDNMCLCKDCSQREHYFDRGFTCTAYGLYERKLITDFKKRGKPYLGRFIGKILHDRIVIEELDFDVIIPVPVHKKRFRERGYNQAEIMARFLGRRGEGSAAIELPLLSSLLLTRKNG